MVIADQVVHVIAQLAEPSVDTSAWPRVESSSPIDSVISQGSAMIAKWNERRAITAQTREQDHSMSVSLCRGRLATELVRNKLNRSANRQISAPPRETIDRLTRIEAAVDAMSVEVERISEGQRFVTKVLSERSTAQS